MKHIAVVEDEALMREELADMLRRAGYAVTEVTDFADVTGQLLALAPDLVLLDLNLPEVSGFQICRDLKRRSALPVLVLTSRDQLRDEVHALELGADEYLTKPYRKERLLAREVAKDLGLTLTAASDWGAGFAIRGTIPGVAE